MDLKIKHYGIENTIVEEILDKISTKLNIPKITEIDERTFGSAELKANRISEMSRYVSLKMFNSSEYSFNHQDNLSQLQIPCALNFQYFIIQNFLGKFIFENQFDTEQISEIQDNHELDIQENPLDVFLVLELAIDQLLSEHGTLIKILKIYKEILKLSQNKNIDMSPLAMTKYN